MLKFLYSHDMNIWSFFFYFPLLSPHHRTRGRVLLFDTPATSDVSKKKKKEENEVFRLDLGKTILTSWIMQTYKQILV